MIATIRKAADVDAARAALIKTFTLSEIQANAILEMQLRRLAALERKKIEDEYEELAAQVAAAEAQNAALQRQLDYLQSDAYVTSEARRLGNVGYPGEQILIIPAGATVPAPATSYPVAAEEPPLLEQWITLFFGAGASSNP